MNSHIDRSSDEDGASSLEFEGAGALDAKVASIYDALRGIARRVVSGHRGKRVLDSTEIVHECYLKLVASSTAANLPEPQLMALAATAIRTVLIDHAREIGALKRGGGVQHVTLHGKSLVDEETVDFLELEDAMQRLAVLDLRMARVVEMRFYGDLTVREVADALGVAARTVDHDWAMARAWLHRELTKSR